MDLLAAASGILPVILHSIGSIFALYILTKIMGYRQISQLSMFDYINGITIGSIAAEIAIGDSKVFWDGLTAMIVYTAVVTLSSIITDHSIHIRRLLGGKPYILFQGGTLYRKNMKKARLDLGEFLTQCRNMGYFRLSDIQTAIMEPNGKLSILPVADNRPVSPKDLNLSPEPDWLNVNVIVNGKIQDKNLKTLGKDYAWLHSQLKIHNVRSAEDVFLATCDHNGCFEVYQKSDDTPCGDIIN